MTIAETPRKAGPYVGNGSVHTYSFAFKVLDTSHLAVVEATPAGVESTLVLASDYTVLLNEDQEATPGGTATRVVETVPTALPLNYRWTILSDAPYSQTMDLPAGGSFSAIVVENAADNLAIQIQQVVETLDRIVTVPPTSSDTPATIVASLIAAAAAADADAAAASASAAAASASASAAAVGNGGRYSDTVGGTANAITLTPSPSLGAYVAGEAITFIAAGTNTGAVTVNVSGLGAKSVTKTGATALVAGEIVSGQIVTLRYDGTRYQVITPAVGTAAANNTGTSGATVPLLNGANTWDGNQVLRSTDGGTEGPAATWLHASASPAAFDIVGSIFFSGFDSTAVQTAYAAMQGQILDPTNGSEDGRLAFNTTIAGSGGYRLFLGNGLYTINATGSDMGLDTINAKAVYDDSVLLTCYAIEAELTGRVTKKRWDDTARNLELEVKGEPPVVLEVKTHEPAARFATRATEMLDPKAYGQSWRATGHLAAMPSPAEWEAAGKKMGVGDIVQRLWETVEVQAIHIDKLLARIEALEAKP